MKTINTNEMGNIFKYGRRTGNTTRQIDAAIQYLFDGWAVRCEDHSHGHVSNANTALMIRILRRIRAEHGYLVSAGHVFVNRDEHTIVLANYLSGFKPYDGKDEML